MVLVFALVQLTVLGSIVNIATAENLCYRKCSCCSNCSTEIYETDQGVVLEGEEPPLSLGGGGRQGTVLHR